MFALPITEHQGMNILVTGGHSGIGFELVRALAADGHRVGVVARSESRVAEVRDAVAPAHLDFFEADLAAQDAVERAASRVLESWGHVDVLFNNAGVLMGELRWSPQKNEMHYEVNTLAPLLLTYLLKPALDAADAPIVVNTSTDPVANAKAIDFDTLHTPKKIVKLFGSYVVSKIAVAAAMESVSAAPAWANVRMYNVAPGAIKTAMTSGEGMPFWLKPIRNLLFSGPEKGAERLREVAFPSGEHHPSPSLVINGRVRPMKFRLDRASFEKVAKGLTDRESFVQSIYSSVESPSPA